MRRIVKNLLSQRGCEELFNVVARIPTLRARLFTLVCCSYLAGCWTVQSRRLFLLKSMYCYTFGGFFGRKQIILLLLESLKKELELLGTRTKAVGIWVRLLR